MSSRRFVSAAEDPQADRRHRPTRFYRGSSYPAGRALQRRTTSRSIPLSVSRHTMKPRWKTAETTSRFVAEVLSSWKLCPSGTLLALLRPNVLSAYRCLSFRERDESATDRTPGHKRGPRLQNAHRWPTGTPGGPRHSRGDGLDQCLPHALV
jgi:hypothetical protein